MAWLRTLGGYLCRADCRLGQRGGVALEFALMTPVLVFTICGMIDFARLMGEDGRISNAALAGVHFGMQSAAHAADADGIVRAARLDAGDTANALNIVADRQCVCIGGGKILCDQSCEDGGKPQMFLKVAVAHTFRTMISYPMFAAEVPLYREAEVRVE